MLATAQTLAEWIGAGRAVTTRGVLKPAAAVEACDLLGIEPPSRKPRSALDIHELMMVWAAASSAGFIEVSGGRVTSGPALQSWLAGAPDAVVAVWSKCVLESLGLVGETNADTLGFLVVLATLDDRGGTASLAHLDAEIAEVAGNDPAGCSCPDCVPNELSGLVVDLGADESEAEDTVRALDEFGVAVLRDDVAKLTPLGHWLTGFLFRESAPPADAEAGVLVSELAQLPPKVAVLMARPWLSSRTAAEAARELLTAGESTSGQERLTALDLVRGCGPGAESAWREWATRDGFGAHARVWLAEQEGTEPTAADSAWITVDALVTMLDALPPELPEDLLPAMLQAQAGDELAEALPLLESCSHPSAPRLVKLLTGPVNPTGLLAGLLPETFSEVLPEAQVLRRSPALPATLSAGTAYQIKVQLLGVTKPPVWRRLQVPADLSLDQLHEVIQTAMGWHNCHMHLFSDGWADYGRPDPELGHQDERKTHLSQLLTGVGAKIGYTYDFGDDWQHEITLEKILPAGATTTGAVCTAGKGACPPEDCGGAWGYENLKATLADPDAEDHDDMLEWLGLSSGDDFDPKEFSAEGVSRRLGHTTSR
ncbi:pRiA4b ORF-3-like protein [Actinophytocola oryzae]|uniref:PRiA4b ORF-3-like protein n=1 Tax=Actinophytocola oryzae TaxID=502181 RepID=A0A4R7V2B5_9PSEU|nr:pRiA4b ORF-3-like protein [Actinophytocola oryzae]